MPIIATITRLLSRELTLQNEYLKTENKILKSKVKGRMAFTTEEKRTLIDAALVLGKDLMKEIVSIVKPATILTWQRQLEKQKWDFSDRRTRKSGRPRVGIDIEKLVCQMARENIWGYARIEGELHKLGIKLCKSTIANILRRNGLPPSPERKGLTWREFLSRHADVFLCADFFTKEVWTFKGLKTAFVFFVIHLQTRRVILAKATFSPNSFWIKQQLRHAIWACEDQNITIKYFLRDNDSCYSNECDILLKSAGIKTVRTPLQAPNANSHAERFVLSIKKESLDHMLVFGVARLERLVAEYISYFNEHRPHQGIDNAIPSEYKKLIQPKIRLRNKEQPIHGILRKEFCGGLLKSYQRAA